jgi:hypothetical protein
VKKLLVSGDSWTSCWPLEERLGHREFGWPNLVASEIGYTLIDKSRAGSSNYRIYRKGFDSMLDGTADLNLIFLTSWTRIETGSGYGDKPGGIYQHKATDKSPESDYVFKNFFNGYKNYTDLLRMIISLQKLAVTLKTECYFLDTFKNNLLFDITESDFKKILSYNILIFDNMSDDRIKDKFNKVKMLTTQIDQSKFISLSSYEELITGCQLIRNHPVEDGHSKISKIILDFLKENKYDKTI